MRRYAGLCWRVASRILGGQESSYIEDAVQETFYAVFAKLAQWQGGNLAAWVGTIAARRALDLRRRLRRTRAEKTGLDVTDFPAPTQDASTTDLATLRQAIERARGGMTTRQQQVLDGLLGGRTRDELAAQLGVSPRTVYYELGEIRRRLRNSLDTIADQDGSSRL